MTDAPPAEHHGIREEIVHLAVPIGDLRPYEGNPRVGSVDEIKASLEANGQYRPVVANHGTHTGRPGEILAGNHTFKAAADLGWTHIAATFVDVTDQEARRIVLVDNRTNDLAGYDDMALVEVIRDVIAESGPVGLEGTGYHPDDLDALAQIAYAGADADAVDDASGDGQSEKPWPHTCDGSETVTVHVGDCIERMNEMEASSVDSVVTDPPYAFDMEGWDHWKPVAYQQWCEEWAAAALRVAKPGAHMIVIGGARTHHRMMAGIEDAGWEIRDFGAWLYRSGWPKGTDVSASLDEQAGVDRADRRTAARDNAVYGPGRRVTQKGTPVSEQARKWSGWSTALKPSIEPWVIARKPLESDTLVENLQQWGTGAINVAAVRHDPDDQWARQERLAEVFGIDAEEGRWPANVLTDEPDEDLRHFRLGAHLADFRKASQSEKPTVKNDDGEDEAGHPTVKPIELCRHFVRLATPPGGVVLDPFAGSGTTAEAAIIDGFHCVLTERDESYLPLIRRRVERTGSVDQLEVRQA